MGLDSVALVLRIEETFDVAIPDPAAERMRTPRDVIDYLTPRLQPGAQEVCDSHRAFNLLRKVFQNGLGTERADFRPAMPLERIVPLDRRQVLWSQLAESSGAGTWPELIRSPAVFRLLAGTVLAVSLTVGVLLSRLTSIPTTVAAIVALILAIPVARWAAIVSRPLKTSFSPRTETIGGLVSFVAAMNPELVTNEPTRWSRSRVAFVLKEVVKDQLGVDNVEEDDRFVEDLGVA